MYNVFDIHFWNWFQAVWLGSLPWLQKKSLSLILGFIVAYEHDKINILVSVLNIIFFLFDDINLNTQDFACLEFLSINWALVETYQFSWNEMYAYLLQFLLLLFFFCFLFFFVVVFFFFFFCFCFFCCFFLLLFFCLYRHIKTVFLYQDKW